MHIAQNISGVAPHSVSVGPFALSGRALLAPMSGVTDVGMRRIARRFGAALVVTEMVACDEYLNGGAEANLRAEGEGVAPHVVQLVGREPAAMARAARQAQDAGAAIIDINMGCPAKRVAGALCGSALMRDLDHASRIIAAVVGAVSVPVTLKMRLGWDCINAPDLARRAQAAGVRMLTVHGRTRAQFYTGQADWRAIAGVVEAVDIPVVANGDCADVQSARAMLAQSGAAAVMIGRAAVGAPWLIGAIGAALDGREYAPPTAAERREAAQEHLDGLLTRMGSHAGLRHARKHLSAYAEKACAPEALRRALVRSEDPCEAITLLGAAFIEGQDRAAA
jgi:nifR3 family TIM-barrel protein